MLALYIAARHRRRRLEFIHVSTRCFQVKTGIYTGAINRQTQQGVTETSVDTYAVVAIFFHRRTRHKMLQKFHLGFVGIRRDLDFLIVTVLKSVTLVTV